MRNNYDPVGPTGHEGATGGTDCQETHLRGHRGEPCRSSTRRRRAAHMTSPVTSPPYDAPVRSVRQAGVPCPASDGYVTTAEGAAYLHVHPKTLRNKCLAGEVRYERIGNRWLRFKRPWLDEYAARWRQPPDGGKGGLPAL